LYFCQSFSIYQYNKHSIITIYLKGHKCIVWNEEENEILLSQRGVSFKDVIYELENNEIIDNYKHPQDNNIGISYQNIIQALIHNYTTNKINLNI